MAETIPIIDLFAGPGGLGEGFSALAAPARPAAFRIALSIEMEPWAHQTLALRSFFHQFPHGQAPAEYYAHIRGELMPISTPGSNALSGESLVAFLVPDPVLALISGFENPEMRFCRATPGRGLESGGNFRTGCTVQCAPPAHGCAVTAL